VMFFVLFLVVRGAPAMLLYRHILGFRDRAALAFYSATALPLVVAITAIAIDAGKMRPSTAAGLVGAAMLSTLIYPFVGLALRTRSEEEADENAAGPPGERPSPLGEGPVAQPGLAG
jgi:Kef-type K+ transport system membrane component KefB